MISRNPTEPNDDLSDLIGGPRIDPVQPPASYQPIDFSEPCKKCRGTGSFIGRNGMRFGPCFTCKGKGKQTFKTSSETRARNRDGAANRKAAQIETFKADYPDVWAWMDGSTFPPAIDMRNTLERYGSLFDTRIEAARRMIAARDSKLSELRAADTARVEQAQPVNVSALEAAFAKARAGQKRPPKLIVASLKIYPAPSGSKNAGNLYVRDIPAALYLGKIAEGKFIRSRDCSPEREAEVLAILADPKAAAIESGKLTGNCAICSRELTDPDSIAAGIGPICATKFGW